MLSALSTYDTLLLEYKPRPIRTLREHRRALQQIEQLIRQHGPHPPRAEGELIAVLSTLIESYEKDKFPRRKPSSAETLAHLIDAKQVTKADVARGTGIPRSTLTNALSGRHQMSKDNVIKLARYFSVDPGVLLPEV